MAFLQRETKVMDKPTAVESLAMQAMEGLKKAKTVINVSDSLDTDSYPW